MFDYAKKIREYRERKFLTKEELAKILGVTFVSISRWERGKFEPNMETKKKLCRPMFLDARSLDGRQSKYMLL